MEPNLLQILFLGLVQGAAELLPVSSSAHVIVAEKLMGLDPSSPAMTFLLVMLHTGTMVAVIAYFWNAWKRTFFASATSLRETAVNVFVATVATLVVGLALKVLIEKVFMHGTTKDEMEDLFGHLPLVGGAIFTAGVLILVAGHLRGSQGTRSLGILSSAWIGISQGFCLPFRGLSRSGTTISVGMLQGINRQRVEEFSFALAVIITPPAVAKELMRLLKSHAEAASPHHLLHLIGPGLIGMIGAFVAGLLALRLLSSWLEKGHWAWFGYYCVAFSGFVFFLASRGY
ncbi:MAG: undecaprenyl-diphosphate phosphatase [Chthoniobacterales bacterium]|jgi:undecaprenyl-diphosphatase|nr:undecaprenyl-diphosphate phosphatase [Chthoniobacterales bacterium]